jgi:hypothetical protein
MKTKLNLTLAFVSLLLIWSASAFAQGNTNSSAATPTAGSTASDSSAAKPAANDANTSPAAAASAIDLARAALAAQGGEKFKNLKSLVLIGSVELYAPNSTQALPGKFVMVLGAGDKYRLEVESPVVKFRQIFDGQQGYSSLPNVQTPNPSKFGLALLTRFEQPGYTVTALPDKKKLRAFRITEPEGSHTDFYIDPATNRIVSFSVPFQGNTFGVEYKSVKEIEGILVPTSFTQRFETPQGAFFADFKVKDKDVHVNQPLGDDVFVIPAQ